MDIPLGRWQTFQILQISLILKTVGANIISDSIPSEYQRELENIFDKGDTIWNRDYLNYDVD